jgi:hypothetical protein
MSVERPASREEERGAAKQPPPAMGSRPGAHQGSIPASSRGASGLGALEGERRLTAHAPVARARAMAAAASSGFLIARGKGGL